MNDPLQAAIYGGIKRGISVCLENDCYAAAVALIYSGIDTMAYLGMADTQQDVAKADFVRWCDRYFRFPGNPRIEGLEWYAARCGVLHTYGSASKLSREGKVRQIGYADRSVPEIRFEPSVTPDLVMVSIEAMAKAFSDGVDKFLVDLFGDKTRGEIAEKRLQTLLVDVPFKSSH